jgi:hypothetical protein
MNIKYIGCVELETADIGLNRFAVGGAQWSVVFKGLPSTVRRL